MNYFIREEAIKADSYDRIVEIIRNPHNTDTDALVELICEIADTEKEISRLKKHGKVVAS